MEAFLNYWLRWPIIETFFRSYAWAWPLCETFHFFGLILLVGTVGMFDLRLLGFAKGLPIAPMRRLLPWGVLGFILAVVTGLMFVTGIFVNVEIPAGTVLKADVYLQLKLLFMALAGLNLLAFYLTGMSRAVENLGAGEDAPVTARIIAGVSLFLWFGVVYMGRLIPFGDFSNAR
jgi:hypothetical protein